jgi:hypothetical protein
LTYEIWICAKEFSCPFGPISGLAYRPIYFRDFSSRKRVSLQRVSLDDYLGAAVTISSSGNAAERKREIHYILKKERNKKSLEDDVLVRLEYGVVSTSCCTHVHARVKICVDWFRRLHPLCDVSYLRRLVPQYLTASCVYRKYPVAPELVLCALRKNSCLRKNSGMFYDLRRTDRSFFLRRLEATLTCRGLPKNLTRVLQQSTCHLFRK